MAEPLQHSVVLVDSGDPRNWETHGVNGFLGLPQIPPSELRARGRDECARHGVTLVDASVSKVEKRSDDHFVACLEPVALRTGRDSRRDGSTPEQVEARRLLLCIGIKDRWPRIPGLRQHYGGTVHVCPDCDGYEARDCKTVVIGTGKRAAYMALALTTWTRHLTVCTNGRPAGMNAEQEEKLRALDIPVLTERILCIHGQDGNVVALDLDGRDPIECERIFFSVGQRPPHPQIDMPSDHMVDADDVPDDDLADQLGCEREGERGSIRIDDHHHTSIYNVFAAGDISPGPQIAVRAAAKTL
jgi:thioredoxin reductase